MTSTKISTVFSGQSQMLLLAIDPECAMTHDEIFVHLRAIDGSLSILKPAPDPRDPNSVRFDSSDRRIFVLTKIVDQLVAVNVTISYIHDEKLVHYDSFEHLLENAGEGLDAADLQLVGLDAPTASRVQSVPPLPPAPTISSVVNEETIPESLERPSVTSLVVGRVRDRTTASGNPYVTLDCECDSNASAAALPSGHTVIAFEERDSTGQTKISLGYINTSVTKNVYYHRKLARGRFSRVGDIESSYRILDFDIFDDVNSPKSGSLADYVQIGFTSGFLAGRGEFSVDSSNRVFTESHFRYTRFRVKVLESLWQSDYQSGFELRSDIGWYLVHKDQDALFSPEVDLPPHLNATGQAIAVANPSVAVASNSQMFGEEQNIFVAYEGFDSGSWNVYLRQIKVSKGSPTPPSYLPPYNLCSDGTICNQVSLYKNDPYCESPYPYVAPDFDPYQPTTYEPTELYTVEVGGDTISRVHYNLLIDSPQGHPVSDNIPYGISESSELDFMFIVDYSGSMSDDIADVRTNILALAQQLVDSGRDVRFGLTTIAWTGSGLVQNWLRAYEGSGATGGFTDSIDVLRQALSPSPNGTCEAIYSGIRFALKDSSYTWRDGADRYALVITDGVSCIEGKCGLGGDYANSYSDALVDCQSNELTVIVAITPQLESCYFSFSEDTGWGGGFFPVTGPYSIDQLPGSGGGGSCKIPESEVPCRTYVLERADEGLYPTFIKPAEVIISYQGDLTPIWTDQRSSLSFVDILPTVSGSTKGLTGFPLTVETTSVFGTDPVHLHGDTDRWIKTRCVGESRGHRIQYRVTNSTNPAIGYGIAAVEVGDPILIARQAASPKIVVNNRNDVFVLYQDQSSGVDVIRIKGTGDFSQDSITGSKAHRLIGLLSDSSFSYSNRISSPDEMPCQMVDAVVDDNDITHVVWQSNQDGRWEIYYGNAKNGFENVRVTSAEGRSMAPKIVSQNSGRLVVVYHDNRSDKYNAMLSYKDCTRIPPLLQQDPYLDGLSSGYTHSTNAMGMDITWADDGYENPYINREDIDITVKGLWVAIPSVLGTSFLGFMNEYSGETTNVGALPANCLAIAGDYRSEVLYLISDTNELYSLEVSGTPSPNIVSWNLVGLLQTPFPGSITALDAAMDMSGRLWILARRSHSGVTTKVLIVYSLDEYGALSGSVYHEFTETIYNNNNWTGGIAISESEQIYNTIITSGGQCRLYVYTAGAVIGNVISVDLVDYCQQLDEQFRYLSMIGRRKLIGMTSDGQATGLSISGCTIGTDLRNAVIANAVGFSYSYQTGDGPYYLRLDFHREKDFSDTATPSLNTVDNSVMFSSSDIPPTTSLDWGNYVLLNPGHLSTVAFDGSSHGSFSQNSAYFVAPYLIPLDERTELPLSDLHLTYSCNQCSIDTDPTPISALNRWVSTGGGYADTQITGLSYNVLNPFAIPMVSGLVGVLSEDTDNGKIIIALADLEEIDVLQPGKQIWYDYDSFTDLTGISNPTGCVDLRNKIIVVYEKDTSSSNSTLPEKVLDYGRTTVQIPSSSSETVVKTGYEMLEDLSVEPDRFAFATVIQKVFVNDQYVDYFTYNNEGDVVPVVSQCSIELTILGRPEIIRFRIRNEEDTEFSSGWLPWKPEIGDLEAEIASSKISWALSNDPGSKAICVQAMTYNGVTEEFRLHLVADYHRPTYVVELYGTKSGGELSDLLPQYSGFYVVGLPPQVSGSVVTVPDQRTIYVRIIPDQGYQLAVDSLYFDLIQQGANDQYSLTANRIEREGQTVYEGEFTIQRDDSLSNVDGMAYVSVKIPTTCWSSSEALATYTRDTLNPIDQGSAASRSDTLAAYRQEVSGRIGTPILVRPTNEDPYLIYGNPKYFLQRSQTEHGGMIVS